MNNKLLRLATTALALSLGSASAVAIKGADGVVVDINSKNSARVISVGGSATETLYALGVGDKVIATDVSSVYPPEAQKLPKVGYLRRLNAEGLIALKPSLIVTNEKAEPKTAIAQLRSAGIPVLVLPDDNSFAQAKTNITSLGRAFGRNSNALQMNRNIDRKLAEAVSLQKGKTPPKVAFIYAREGTMNLAGSGTAAEAVILLGGGVNAVQGTQGYKPVTAEALVAANPDVILLMTRGLAGAGGVEAILKTPGVAQTNAGKNRRIVAMDDALFAFGPRVGDAAIQATKLFFPQ